MTAARSRPVDPRLLRHSSAGRTHLAGCVLLGVASAAAVLGQAALLARAITAVFLDGADLAAIADELALLAALVATRAVLAWAQEAAAARATAGVKAQLRAALLRRTVALGPVWVERRGTGELAALATRGLDAVDPYFARYLPQLVLTCLVPPMFVVAIVMVDWLSGLVVLVTLPVVLAFLVLIGQATQRHTRRQWRSLERLAHHFLDVVDGLTTLRVFGRAAAQRRSIAAVTDDYRRSTLGVLRISFLSAFVLELAASLSVALVAVQIGLRLLYGDLDLGAGLLVLLLAPEVYLPIRQLGASHHAAEEGRAATSGVLDVLDLPVPMAGVTPAPPVAEHGLAIRDLSVHRAGRPPTAPVSLDLTAGEVVALVGPSGAGKSTLLAVLLGFVCADEGTAQVGGVDLARADLRRWRGQVAWMPQRPALSAGTVAENVRLGAPDASHVDVAEVLALAAAPEIDPQRRLGEDGAGLSAGERQRVALARAYLRARRGAGLLLLDEPTSHLDGPTQERVLAGLREVARRRCVLLVTHSTAVAAAADRVVQLGQPFSIAAVRT